MKKNIFVLLSIILTFAIVFSIGVTAAGPKNTKATKKVSVSTNVNKKANDVNSEIRNLKKQASGLVKEISKVMKGYSSGSYANDPQFQAVEKSLEDAKSALKENESKNNYSDALKEYRKLSKKDEAECTAKLEEIINTLNARKAVFEQLVADLNETLQTAKAFAANNKTTNEKLKSFKQPSHDKRKTISENHVLIVKANTQCRTVINQMIATIASNQDILSTKQADLSKITDELKEIKKDISSKFNRSTKEKIKEYNKLRSSKKFDEALAKLDEVIAMQNERLTALGELKSALSDQLKKLEDLVSSSIATTAPATTEAPVATETTIPQQETTTAA